MRVDANVSVRRPGADFNTRCEIKNVNSVRSLGRAIEYEAKRQIALHEAGEPVVQQTRHWDENDGKTHTLRSKEDADDYRYFLEPDLVVVDPGPEWIERVRAELPPLPATRRAALADTSCQPTDSETVMLVVERDQDVYVLNVGREGGDVGLALKHVKESPDASIVVPAGRLAVLTTMEASGAITASSRSRMVRSAATLSHKRPSVSSPPRRASSAAVIASAAEPAPNSGWARLTIAEVTPTPWSTS